MKFILSLAVTAFLFTSTLSAQKLKNNADSLSYAIGVEYATQLKKTGFKDTDIKIMVAAMEDVFANKEPKITSKQANVMYKLESRKRKELVNIERKEEGERFLAENAKRPEVKSLSDGIQYEVLKPGSGPKPEKGGDVKIHYEGKLLDGTVFDSSYERGTPNSFNLKRLIKGWQVALPEMKVGEKWRIYIPYNMAYGERGAGQDIKPYSALIFDIELLGL